MAPNVNRPNPCPARLHQADAEALQDNHLRSEAKGNFCSRSESQKVDSILAEILTLWHSASPLNLSGNSQSLPHELLRVRSRLCLRINPQNRLGAGPSQHEPGAVFRNKLNAVIRFDLGEL